IFFCQPDPHIPVLAAWKLFVEISDDFKAGSPYYYRGNAEDTSFQHPGIYIAPLGWIMLARDPSILFGAVTAINDSVVLGQSIEEIDLHLQLIWEPLIVIVQKSYVISHRRADSHVSSI